MKILRTPDDRFVNLPDFNYAPHYTTVRDEDGTEIRIHHIDEGPRDADPILLMHGNPTWAFLYRKMIPGLLKSGKRVIAVDLVGCGRSDKPAAKSDYTLARHYDWMSKWLQAMNLKNITLFCQDWGGTIGIYLVSLHPERFARVVAANTGLPLGEGENEFMKMWVGMMKEATEFPWHMLHAGMTTKLTEAEDVSDGEALIEAVDVLDGERELVEVVDADTPSVRDAVGVDVRLGDEDAEADGLGGLLADGAALSDGAGLADAAGDGEDAAV